MPELTSRTCSTGVRATISAASSTSPGVGVPKLVPCAAAAVTSAATTSGWAWPRISGPQERDQVDVASPVRVEQVRTLAPDHEPGGAADGPERAHGRVDPARHERAGAVEEVLRGRRVGGVYVGHGTAILSAELTVPPRDPAIGIPGAGDLGLVAWRHDDRRPGRRSRSGCRPTRTHHGDTVTDDYAWLADKDDPDTIAYLTAENDVHRGPHRPPGRAPGDDLQRDQGPDQGDRPVGAGPQGRVLVLHPHGRGPAVRHPLPARRSRRARSTRRPPRTVDRSTARTCCSTATSRPASPSSSRSAPSTVSPDGNLLAYSVDLERRRAVHPAGQGPAHRRTAAGHGDRRSFYGSAWSADGSTLFYLTVDEAWRPNKVWRHHLGTPTTDDVLVLEEPDERFWVGVGLTRSEAYVIIDMHSKLTSEVHVIPAGRPDGRAGGGRRRVGRASSTRSSTTRPATGSWCCTTTAPRTSRWPGPRPRARGLARADPAHPRHPPARRRRVRRPHGGVAAPRRAHRRCGSCRPTAPPYDVDFPEPVYTVGLDANPEYDTASIRLQYTSLVTPDSVYDYDLRTRELVLRKQRAGAGRLRPGRLRAAPGVGHRARRHPGADLLVCRRDTPRDGVRADRPLWIRLLRDEHRPVVLHRPTVPCGPGLRLRHRPRPRRRRDGPALVRGGQAAGQAEHVHRLRRLRPAPGQGAAGPSPERIVARGGSAGGLLVGAVANLAPRRSPASSPRCRSWTRSTPSSTRRCR